MKPGLIRRVKHLLTPKVQPDARVAVLANELRIASLALARAADAMKRQAVTPLLTTQTRAAATRGEGTLNQLGIAFSASQPKSDRHGITDVNKKWSPRED